MSHQNTTRGWVQEFRVLWTCRVFLTLSKVHFFLAFTVYFYVLPGILFPSSSPSVHFAQGCRAADYTPLCLPALLLQLGRDVAQWGLWGVGRDSTQGSYSSKLYEHLNSSEPPSSLISKRRLTNNVFCHKTVFFAAQEKTWAKFAFHVHRGSTPEPASSSLSINHIPSCTICFQANRNANILPANAVKLHIPSSNKSYAIPISPYQYIRYLHFRRSHPYSSASGYLFFKQVAVKGFPPYSSSSTREHNYPNILLIGII